MVRSAVKQSFLSALARKNKIGISFFARSLDSNTEHFTTRAVPGQDAHLPHGNFKPLSNDLPHAVIRVVPKSRFLDRDQEYFPFLLDLFLPRAGRNKYFYIHTSSVAPLERCNTGLNLGMTVLAD